MNFDPNAVIKTERLTLRFLKLEDKHDIFVNINSDKDVLKYFIDKYCEKEEDMVIDKVIDYCMSSKRYCFAIELNDTHEVIGMILQCSDPNKIFNTTEVGFAIGKKFWNKGYVTEAFKAMIKFLFSQGIHKVIASHLVGNDASGRVMKKCGLTYEGKRIHEVFYHNEYHDVEYYYILNNN